MCIITYSRRFVITVSTDSPLSMKSEYEYGVEHEHRVRLRNLGPRLNIIIIEKQQHRGDSKMRAYLTIVTSAGGELAALAPWPSIGVCFNYFMSFI